MVKEKLCYTIQEAAELLSISKITLYRKVEAGTLPHRRIGSRILIDHEILMNYGKQDEAE